MEAISRLCPSVQQLGSRDEWERALEETNGAGVTDSVQTGCLCLRRLCYQTHARVRAQTRLSQVRLDIGLLCTDVTVDMGF